jgi:hypothetical protein
MYRKLSRVAAGLVLAGQISRAAEKNHHRSVRFDPSREDF